MKENEIKRNIVVSAVNLTEGGPLTILLDCLEVLNSEFCKEYNIYVLVHKKELVRQFSNVIIMEYPMIKSSWLKRLKFEYWDSSGIAGDLKPYLWLALHDVTPRLKADIKAVYCHNPSPFYKISRREARMDIKFFLFSLFYKVLYSININSNNYVIVQQNWLREEFKKITRSQIIVAYPEKKPFPNTLQQSTDMSRSKNFLFYYPAFPRVFKNFEILLSAAAILSQKRKDFEVRITISGNENAYSKLLFEKYGKVDVVKFIGLQRYEDNMRLFSLMDCLIFPSKLETWGLPLTEAKAYGKPILAINLKYTYETVNIYDKVKYFDCNCPEQLADYMSQVIDNSITYDHLVYKSPDMPFVKGWQALFSHLLN